MAGRTLKNSKLNPASGDYTPGLADIHGNAAARSEAARGALEGATTATDKFAEFDAREAAKAALLNGLKK